MLRIIILRTWASLPIVPVLLLLGFFYVAAAGVILNDLATETTVAGFRYFFRFVPLFLVAYAFRLTDQDVALYFKWIAGILLLQIPLTIWQRFVTYEGVITGDIVVGSLGSSSSLAIFSAAAIAATVVALLDKRISPTQTLGLSLLFLIPAGLAETKVTPFLLVIGVLAVLWCRRQQLDFRRVLFLGGSSMLLLAAFMLMYNILYSTQQGLSFYELVFDPERSYHFEDITIAEDALSTSAPPSFIIAEDDRFIEADISGVVTKAGRIDAMLAPFQVLLPDHIEEFAIGLGVGNISSNLGEGGRYRQLEIDLGGTTTTISHLLWETGLAGTLLYLLMFLTTLHYAYRCSLQTGPSGTLGTQMFAAVTVLIVCLMYTDYFFKPDILTPFAIFAGHVSLRSRVSTLNSSGAQRSSPALSVDAQGNQQRWLR